MEIDLKEQFTFQFSLIQSPLSNKKRMKGQGKKETKKQRRRKEEKKKRRKEEIKRTNLYPVSTKSFYSKEQGPSIIPNKCDATQKERELNKGKVT
jgi:hypothetical protein